MGKIKAAAASSQALSKLSTAIEEEMQEHKEQLAQNSNTLKTVENTRNASFTLAF